VHSSRWLADERVVFMAWFHPSSTQAVLVVAADDAGALETEMRSEFGHFLCVVHSRWPRRQVDATLNTMVELASTWRIYDLSQGLGSDGQVVLTAFVEHLEPEFVRWAQAVPDELLQVSVWLTRV